jgi:hypothetical protein
MATAKTPAAALSDLFIFDPGHVSDPAPPWLLQQLSPELIRALGRVHLEASAEILKARLNATQKALEIVARAK